MLFHSLSLRDKYASSEPWGTERDSGCSTLLTAGVMLHFQVMTRTSFEKRTVFKVFDQFNCMYISHITLASR